MAKSHKEVISHFKTQSETLAQMAAAFPDQAAHVKNMLERIHAIDSCVRQAALELEEVQGGLKELQEFNKGPETRFAPFPWIIMLIYL